MKIWVVLPAYNEETALPLLLDSLIMTLEEDQLEWGIIVVNDGSTDQTGMILDRLAEREKRIIPVHQNPNMGLAETMRRGLLEAAIRSQDGSNSKQDIVITMDADNTHPAGLMLRMIRLIREGNDVVIASRYREGSAVIGVPWHRELLSMGAAILFRLLFPIRGVRDYTCGYRAYRSEVIGRLISVYGRELQEQKGFSCMVDILLRLRSEHYVFTEVPLVLRYDLKPGQSKMKVMKTIFETLSLILKRRF